MRKLDVTKLQHIPIADMIRFLGSERTRIDRADWADYSEARYLTLTYIAMALHSSQYDDFRSQDRDEAIVRNEPYPCSKCGAGVFSFWIVVDDWNDDSVDCAWLCPACLSQNTISIPLKAEASHATE